VENGNNEKETTSSETRCEGKEVRRRGETKGTQVMSGHHKNAVMTGYGRGAKDKLSEDQKGALPALQRRRGEGRDGVSQ